MKCGRQIEGKNVEKNGVCPAASTNKHDGINNGKYGGRFCWAVAGTLCGGKIQGTYATKLKNCLNCKFLKKVDQEEGRHFILAPKLR